MNKEKDTQEKDVLLSAAAAAAAEAAAAARAAALILSASSGEAMTVSGNKEKKYQKLLAKIVVKTAEYLPLKVKTNNMITARFTIKR